MNFDLEKYDRWLKQQELFLPSIAKIFDSATSPVMILGASVMALYGDQEWIPPLRRQTGDLDLSVSLPHGESDYLVLKNTLKVEGYSPDRNLPFRYHTPKPVPGALAYIDLLAQPSLPKTTKPQAIAAMGAGGNFSFEGFDFALQTGFKAGGQIIVPNPIGFLALKKVSYKDDPLRRVKDLGDIIELCIGMVSKGSHYDLADRWNSLSVHPESHEVRAMVSALASSESTTWDVQDARQELLKRGFSSSQIDDDVEVLLKDWVEVLVDPTEA